MKKLLFGNAAIYLATSIFNAAIPFLLLPFLTTALSPADYGIVAMFWVAVSIFGAFTSLSLNGAVGVRYFQLDKSDHAQYIGTCMLILLGSTFIMLLTVFAFSKELHSFSGVPQAWLLLAIIVSGLQFIVDVRLVLWQSQKMAKPYGLFQIAQGLLNAGLTVLLVIALTQGWQGRIAGQAGAIFVFAVIAAIILLKLREVAVPRQFKKQAIDALKFGIPLIPHAIGGMVIASSGRFIATNTHGVAATGIYMLALQFGVLVGFVADAFVKVYGPWLYEKLKDPTDHNKLIVVGATYFVCAGFLVIPLIANVVVTAVFPYIVGPQFHDALDIIIWFLIGNGFHGMYLSVAGFFFFSTKTSVVSFVTLASGAIAILGGYYLAERVGLKGIAMAFAISRLSAFLFAWALSTQIYQMPWLHPKTAAAALFKSIRS